MDWSMVTSTDDPNTAYNIFLKQFLLIYNTCFPKKRVEIKRKSLLSPWITSGLIKSSKKKEKLYVKFLKHRTYANEKHYKTYKNMFETIKTKSKKNHYSSLLFQHQGNARKTWETMKELIGKTKIRNNNFPRRILINKQEIYDQSVIANEFNNFFVNVGSNLAAKIPSSEKHFSEYMNQTKEIIPINDLTIKEYKNAFDSLKTNRACGFDDIDTNIIKSCYKEMFCPLFYICKRSIKVGSFPDQMKIAKITPLFKSGEYDIVSNYRPISVLPVFSKLLERIMYNRVYSHITKHLLLYEKQFGFQKQCSTEHAILQLTKEIYESFDQKKFTLGVFVDLSKAFDTVNHEILISKLSYYGIKSTYINWFKSYLTNRKQYITCKDLNSKTQYITCGVPQGSILGPLLFLLYVNDLKNVSQILKPIMFADDTNFFYTHKNIKNLFETVNKELKSVQTWFNANKLSLNISKTKYSFFHSKAYSNLIPLQLPALKINNMIIKRETTMKFLGILLDENLSWKQHINYIEKKISKNNGILYKSRYFLNEKCSKMLYFAFIHSYLNYGNITWGSTTKTNLTLLLRRQKHAARTIYFKDKFTHSKPLMVSLNALNIYQLNIYQTLLFMYKIKNNITLPVFQPSFTEVNSKYNTKSSNIFYKPFCNTKHAQYAITYRGPYLWNSIIDKKLQNNSLEVFKNTVKHICLQLENAHIYF